MSPFCHVHPILTLNLSYKPSWYSFWCDAFNWLYRIRYHISKITYDFICMNHILNSAEKKNNVLFYNDEHSIDVIFVYQTHN